MSVCAAGVLDGNRGARVGLTVFGRLVWCGVITVVM